MNTPLTITDLYTRYSGALRAHIHAMLGGDVASIEDTEDILQEVFLSASRHWDALHFQGAPWPWLKMIATNTTINELRRRRARAGRFVDPNYEEGYYPDPRERDPEEVMLARENARQRLASMTPEERTVLVQEALSGVTDRMQVYNARRNWQLREKRYRKAVSA